MSTNTSNGCPYKGLQPYTEEDREYFFGRERDTEVIASNLYIAPLTILYGTSGVGKSSVLQAGVMPHLRENRRVIVLLFNNWQGENFNAALKERVLNAVCASTGKTQQEVLSEVSEMIGAKEVIGLDRLPLDELVTACAVGFRRRILVILDQFEEYFLYHAPTTSMEGFDAEFARAVNHPESGVNFMIAMREEELSKLDRFRPRIPNLLGNLLRLENLDAEAANNAIRKPLRIYNERHPAEAMSIEDGLVTAIIEQVRPAYVKHAAAGTLSTGSDTKDPQLAVDKIGTPFLQLVLMRLWEAEKLNRSHVLRLSTFEGLGGALEIARSHLDNVMAQVTDSQRATAAAVLRFLVTPTGSKIALDAASLASFANEKKEDVLAVLDLLGSGKEMRILRKVTARGQDDRYELFHDVLGPAILDWRSRYVQTQRAIQERAEAEKEFSIERQKRLRQAVAVLAVLLLLMGAMTVYAFSQRSEALEQTRIALEQKRIADTALEKAKEAQKALEEEKKRVEKAAIESDEQRAIAEERKEEALSLRALEAAARQTAEAEKRRANEQALLATNLVRISEFNLKGFDAARLGLTDESITNFNHALNLSREQNNAPGEAYALVNMADGYGTKGAVIPLELFTLFDKYEGNNYEGLLFGNYQAMSYVDNLQRMIEVRKESLLADQAKAIESYQAAIEANRQQKDPDLKKEAWIQQRIGDVQLTTQILLTAQKDSGDVPDLSPVFKSYNDASDSYSRAGLPLEEGTLQTRIGFIQSFFLKTDNVNKTDLFKAAISAYERALKAFQTGGAVSREAATLVRLGETYKESASNNPEYLKLAIGYYSQAADVYGMIGERQNQGDNYSLAAPLYVKLSPPDKDRAFESYAKALKAFQDAKKSLVGLKEPELKKQQELLHAQVLERVKDIARLYVQDPKPRANLEEYFKGVIAAYGSDYAGKTSVLHAIGDLYNNELKDKLTAIKYYQAESQVWQEARDPLRQAGVLLITGNIYDSLNERYKAKLSFEEVRKIYQDPTTKIDAAARDRVAADLITIARTYSDFGEKKLALETYDQGLRLYEGPDKSTSYRINDIIQSASKLLTEPDAPAFFDRLTQFYRNRSDSHGEASAFELEGELYAEWGKTSEALEFYNRGLALRPTPFNLLDRIGKLYYKLNNEAGAKKFFDTVVKSYHDRKDIYGEKNALSSIGAFYRASGNSTEAINHYTKAVQIFCREKNSYEQGNVLRVLSTIFAGLGDSEEAARLDKLAKDPQTVNNCDFQIRRPSP